MEKEKWINDVLKSMDNKAELKAPDFLFNRIESKIKDSQVPTIDFKWIVSIAASLLILVSLNISFITKHKSNISHTDKIDTEFIYFESNQLY
jgi:hypothetical protein